MPEIIATTATRNATDTIIPSRVKKERSLLTRICSSAVVTTSTWRILGWLACLFAARRPERDHDYGEQGHRNEKSEKAEHDRHQRLRHDRQGRWNVDSFLHQDRNEQVVLDELDTDVRDGDGERLFG